MKKYIRLFYSAAVSLLFITSCSKEEPESGNNLLGEYTIVGCSWRGLALDLDANGIKQNDLVLEFVNIDGFDFSDYWATVSEYGGKYVFYLSLPYPVYDDSFDCSHINSFNYSISLTQSEIAYKSSGVVTPLYSNDSDEFLKGVKEILVTYIQKNQFSVLIKCSLPNKEKKQYDEDILEFAFRKSS